MSNLEGSLSKALDRQTSRRRPETRDRDTETQNTETRKSQRKVEEPQRGRGGHIVQENPHTKRLTVDLDTAPGQSAGSVRPRPRYEERTQ